MQLRCGERLRLTLSGAGGRAMVSVNTYAVTEAALEGIEPSLDGFTFDVTPWLHAGRNTLTVVLIGSPGENPFRMTVAADHQPAWTLDEGEFLPVPAPWRLWTQAIEAPEPQASEPATSR